MKTALVTLATLAALTAQAQAGNQLAQSLGLDGAGYTTAQLAQLKAAQEADGTGRYRALLDRFNAPEAAPSGRYEQLAASVGAGAGQYTLPELARIRAAQEADNNAARPFSATERSNMSTRGAPSAGHRQLAASLGVDPSTHTLGELAVLLDD